MEKTIYNLELHEDIYINGQDCYVARVAGGWLYKYYTEVYDAGTTSYKNVIDQIVFVPYNNEFQKVQK